MSDQPKPIQHPKNNWELAEMIRDGFTCEVKAEKLGAVIGSLDYHGLSADLEIADGVVTITPRQK